MKSVYIFLFWVGFASNLFSQESNYGNWLIYFGNNALSKKINWHNEFQIRNFNAFGDNEQLLLRTGIGYNLSENNNNALLGYAYVNSNKYSADNSVKTNTTEHRIFQQFITKQNFAGINLLHRYRLEERFVESNFSLRFRYFLLLNIPLNNKVMKANTWYASMYNEIFISNSSPRFDRDRVYAAIGYQINNSIKVELGTMTQLLENTNRNQFQIVVYNNTPFFK